MGLSLLNSEFPSPAGRFLLLTTKVGNRTLLSKKILSFFLDAANLELDSLARRSQSHEYKVIKSYRIRVIRVIRVR